MFKSRRHQKRQTKKKIQGIIILCIVVPVAAVLVYFNISAKLESTSRDPVTFCPKKGPKGFVAILIDATDNLNNIQKLYLDRYFSQFKTNLEKDYQVSVYIVDQESLNILKPNTVICNPGTLDGSNSFTQNPTLINRRWETNFSTPLSETLDSLLEHPGSKTSPIMEMIQAVSVDTFQFVKGQNKRLIIISDMLQNTPSYSHYKTKIDFEKFKNSSYFRNVKTNLNNVDVQLLYVPRKGYENIQVRKHINFWEKYFKSCGGDITVVSRVEG